MPDHLPTHPDSGSGAGHHSPRGEPAADGRSGGSRSRVLLIVGAVALVALILVLHLTGVVGAGSH